MYNKKTSTFTFHHYWGAFVLDPIDCMFQYAYMNVSVDVCLESKPNLVYIE